MQHKNTHCQGGTMTIVETIKQAHGNRAQLLSLATLDTHDQVAAHFNTSLQVCAPKVAQRLFDAQAITIKGSQQTYGRKFSKRYDLTDENQACAALRWWRVASHSLQAWNDSGKDIYKYHDMCEADSSLYSHCVQTLKLTRHKNNTK